MLRALNTLDTVSYSARVMLWQNEDIVYRVSDLALSHPPLYNSLSWITVAIFWVKNMKFGHKIYVFVVSEFFLR